MSIFLTGGSGFIGRNIVESLSDKYEILSPGHGRLDLTDDVAVRDFFRSNKIDTVIHSATKPGHRNAADPTGLVYANTRMFLNIMRNKDSFGKLIYLGSGAEYDMRHYMPKMKEEYFDTWVPADETGYSKYICAKCVELTKGATELRLFGVFGKYEDYAIRFISNAICKTLFDLPITIKQNRRFDYLFIDDLMPVLEYFMANRGNYSCYNVTPDRSAELAEIALKVRQISGKDVPIIIAQDGMGMEYSGDNGRLKEQMPGLSLTPMDDAIEKLYGWYKENVHLINRSHLLTDK
jgi:UDP-glucose 4-epimerase